MTDIQEVPDELEISFLDISSETPMQEEQDPNQVMGQQQMEEILMSVVARFEGGIQEIVQLIEEDEQDIKNFKENQEADINLEDVIDPDIDSEDDPTAFLSASIPGSSLTGDTVDPKQGTLGKYPWESPPEFPSPIDAMNFLLERTAREPDKTNLMKLLYSGIHAETLARTATFMGYMEGAWTPDVSELLVVPLMFHLIADAQEQGIKAKIFNDVPEDEITADTVLDILEDNNPEELARIDSLPDEVEEEEMMDEEIDMGSFLDMEEMQQ